MAVTMSEATVDDSQRKTLLNSNVDASITQGGATPNKSFFGLGDTTGATLAGITSTFTEHLHTEISDYTNNINTILGKLESVESNVAFQGEAIKKALSNFIISVKNVSINYTNKLRDSEKQIISEVARVYGQQDTDLSGNLGTDSSNLEQNNTLS